MSRSPSPDNQLDWEAVAARLKTDSNRKSNLANNNYRASEDRESQSNRSTYSTPSNFTSFSEIDTSDTRVFQPQNKEKAIARSRAQRRDIMTGWDFRGSNAEGGTAVNVLKRDSMLIDLAVEGRTTLEAQLKMASKPIIGLDELVEYIDPDADLGAPRVYHCTLCSVYRTVATIMEHLVSYNHRRKRFPAETKAFLCPDGKTINRANALAHIAQKRASDIELVYGRGTIKVLHERPVYPQEALEAEDTLALISNTGRNLDFLNDALEKFKNFRPETQEEYKRYNKLLEYIQDGVLDWRVRHRQEDL